MKAGITALERAFELARSGHINNTYELKKALEKEGYFVHDITGPSLITQLRAAIKLARALGASKDP